MLLGNGGGERVMKEEGEACEACRKATEQIKTPGLPVSYARAYRCTVGCEKRSPSFTPYSGPTKHSLFNHE